MLKTRTYSISRSMASALFAFTALFGTQAFATTTYGYVGKDYSTIYHNCTPPGDPSSGPCVTYATSMHVQGWFSLDTPLPANFGPTDISARTDLKWSFSDGINIYASTDGAHALIESGSFVIQTDATGTPVFPGTSVDLDLWQTTPAANHFYDFINIGYQPVAPHLGDYVGTGEICFTVVGNQCMSDNVGANVSYVASVTSGTWAILNPTSAAPMMGFWATLALLAVLVVAGARGARRRNNLRRCEHSVYASQDEAP